MSDLGLPHKMLTARDRQRAGAEIARNEIDANPLKENVSAKRSIRQSQ
jgi:hypothetical protein